MGKAKKVIITEVEKVDIIMQLIGREFRCIDHQYYCHKTNRIIFPTLRSWKSYPLLLDWYRKWNIYGDDEIGIFIQGYEVLIGFIEES